MLAVGGGVGAGGGGLLIGLANLNRWSEPRTPNAWTLVAVAVFGLGMVLLVRAWMMLWRAVVDGQVSSGRVLIVASCWAVPFVVGPPLGSLDVYAYAGQGVVASSGLDPYEVPPGLLPDSEFAGLADPIWEDSPSPYGPAFVAAGGGVVSAAAGDVGITVLGFRLLALAGLALVAASVPVLARASGRSAPEALVLTIANPLVLLHFVGGAHNDALMVGLLCVGLAVGLDRRWHLAGLVLCGLAAAVKAPALLGCLVLGWCRPQTSQSWLGRGASALAGVGVGVGVVSLAGLATGLGWGWAEVLLAERPVLDYLSLTTIVGWLLAQAGDLLGLSTTPGSVVAVVRPVGSALAVLGSIALLVDAHRRPSPMGLEALAGMLLLVAGLGPGTQAWHLVWGAVLVGAVGTAEPTRRLILASVALCFAVPPTGPELGRVVIEETSPGAAALAVAALVAAAWVAWRPFASDLVARPTGAQVGGSTFTA